MMQRRQICERSVCDGSADDPRVLVHRYQQRVRAQLLAKAAVEAARKPWWLACLSPITSAYRLLMTPATRQVAAPAMVSATSRRLVPVRLSTSMQVGF
jgi:hypothetical protein